MRPTLIILAALGLALCACTKSADNKAAPVVPAPTPTPDTTPQATGWKYQQNLDRAVRWALDNQKRQGDWGYMTERPNDIYLGSINSLHVWGNASTALCLMGLLMQPPTDEINAALAKGFEYLIDAPDTPRATMNTFYNVWSHTYMVQALTRAMADARFAKDKPRLRKRAEHELRRLLDHQSLDGGWGYYDFDFRTLRPSGDISTAFTTAAALVAMHEAFKSDLRLGRSESNPDGEGLRDHNVQIALDYLQRHRIPNGAYYYSSGHMHYPQGVANLPRGSLGRSQSGDNALNLWGRLVTQDMLKAQLDTFLGPEHVFIEIGRGRQFPHEAWYATAPYYYYFGHYHASRNVLALSKADQPKYGDKLGELVVAGQYDDGSFWDYPLYGYAKPYGTGFGIIILSNCKKAME
ncbi:MAG: hypothetical protein IPK87_08025 [Planctomycetes bacterium]|nr:hypothetical protein [Planctomycetota bacterium]